MVSGPAWRPPSREARDTLFMLALIGWTVLPHLPHLPPWVAVLTGVVLSWRAWLAWRQAPLPGRRSVLLLLTLAALLTFRGPANLVGRDAWVTLLTVLMALKTLELRARRDALVVFFLGFFLVLTSFLYSQSLLVAVMAALAVWGWLTALTLAHMPAGQPAILRAAAVAGRAAAVGTPMMLALFLLFPRIGPLWSMPDDRGTTGLSEHLQPGQVADLANDDSIALRLRFDGPAPRPDALYFRGPVLTDTDGRDWRAGSLLDGEAPPGAFVPAGRPTRYEMTLEPTHIRWLPLLELAAPSASTPTPGGIDTALAPRMLDGTDLQPLAGADDQWHLRRPLDQRVRVQALAWLGGRLTEARPADLQRNLALPRGVHPRTRAWARDWLAQQALAGAAPDADALAAGLYGFIRHAGFTYTLTPGTYDGDTVDEFWLDRRAGFCEHFATAFVVVLRAMGVPARVVTGYQGADPQLQDGDLIVRQSNAHAWAEYWQPDRGWVRADPTAAVAPDRIRRGRALTPRRGLVGGVFDAVSPTLLQNLRAWREIVDKRWNDWVLGYSRNAQFDLMRRLGLPEPDSTDLGRLLVIVIATVAAAGAAAAWWDARRRTPGERLARRLAQALRPLAPQGLEVPPHASCAALARQVRERFGDRGEALAAALDAFERRRYGPDSDRPHRLLAPGPWRALGRAARALAAGGPPP